MTENGRRVSRYERILQYLQDHQHVTSFIVASVFFILGMLQSATDFKDIGQFCKLLALNMMLGIATFFMCELFMVTQEFRKDLRITKERLPAQVAEEIGKATASIVDASIALASPHLHISLVDYPEKWLRLFADARPQEAGKRNAVEAVKLARRGIVCKVYGLDVKDYADVADVLLEGAACTVESTTYFPNHEFIDELKNKKSEVREWILNVNKWASKEATRRVHRVHLFEPDDQAKRDCKGEDTACSYLRSASQFINLLDESEEAKKFYVKEYASPVALNGRLTFHPCALPKKEENPPTLPPECIVLDRQVALMYEPRFRQLRLFFGSIAEEMGAAFTGTKFKSIESGAMRSFLEREKAKA